MSVSAAMDDDDFEVEFAEERSTEERVVPLPLPRTAGNPAEHRRRIERYLEMRRLQREIEDFDSLAAEPAELNRTRRYQGGG